MERSRREAPRMKRSIIVSAVIGLIVAGVLCAVQACGVLFRPEFAVTDLIMRHSNIARLLANHWQYFFIILFAFAVAWATVEGAPRGWAWWVVAILIAELIGITLVCALYRLFFQPLPSVLAVIGSFLLGGAYHLLTRGSRARLASDMFSAHVSPQQLERVIAADFPLESRATSHEATVIVCDIANKHELAEDAPPDAIASMLDQFVRFASDIFLKQGAYIQSADGEGVVGIFGFPVNDENHAELAAGAALEVQRAFGELKKSDKKAFGQSELHLGLSSGTLVAARLQDNHQTEIVPMGEPLELARRFCIANRIYGSRILLGPRTFELAEQATVARPIDFLGGATSRERYEIYELLSLTKSAKPEDVERRDNFWSGVVYYRERRWEEAYAAFQKSWGESGHEDAPLQLYLRRLEPLVLRLSESAPTPNELPT
jgi:adenylate cyclase